MCAFVSSSFWLRLNEKFLEFVKAILDNAPSDWLSKTTHRLDVYNEDKAKVEFLEELEILFKENRADASILTSLPTAYDYIRLGHPLSCLLEWTVAKLHNIKSENVISFSSSAMPVLAVLRKNLLDRKNTRIQFRHLMRLQFLFQIQITFLKKVQT